MNRRVYAVVMMAGMLSGCAGTVRGESVLRPMDRILFVGDSITGHSMNLADGYCRQMTWALKQAHPDGTHTLVSLGGSGQGVGSWMGRATYTNAEPAYLDIRGVELRTTLDAGADVLVVMLGMNDLLAPYISDTPEGVGKWRGQYEALLRVLRTRTRPRLTALCSVTLLTEDHRSPKNVMRERLNREIADLAKAEGCLYFPTGEATSDLLRRGRVLDPGFHVARDFVHPGAAGHAAIATTMLKGLGETRAAQLVEERYLGALVPAGSYPVLSYEIVARSHGGTTQTNTYALTYWWSAGPTASRSAIAALSLPDGWRLDSQTHSGTGGVFTVTGCPDAITNALVLRARSADVERIRTVAVPTPWRVCAGVPSHAAWVSASGFRFNPTNGLRAVDRSLIEGDGFATPVVHEGQSYPWVVYTPSVDYTGGEDPASVDPFALTFGKVFDSLYAARWIYSARRREADLRLSSSVFAGTIGVGVWLNGVRCYAGTLTAEPKKCARVGVTLEAGWNRLFVKADHTTWQWQFACAVEGRGGDDLDDLRYAAVPPTREGGL